MPNQNQTTLNLPFVEDVSSTIQWDGSDPHANQTTLQDPFGWFGLDQHNPPPPQQQQRPAAKFQLSNQELIMGALAVAVIALVIPSPQPERGRGRR